MLVGPVGRDIHGGTDVYLPPGDPVVRVRADYLAERRSQLGPGGGTQPARKRFSSHLQAEPIADSQRLEQSPWR